MALYLSVSSQCRIEERQEQQHGLPVQMREQCGEYEGLLGQTIDPDIEIAAYRRDLSLMCFTDRAPCTTTDNVQCDHQGLCSSEKDGEVLHHLLMGLFRKETEVPKTHEKAHLERP